MLLHHVTEKFEAVAPPSLQKIKTILQKRENERTHREVIDLYEHFKSTTFFKELKLKPTQLQDVVN